MNDICKIPVKATFRIIDGEAVMVAAEYADIPADAIAAYIRLSVRNDDSSGFIEN